MWRGEDIRRESCHVEALERLSEQTRERFRLGPEAVVLVSELACALPGCPPLETVVLFWSKEGVRHRFKIFKPVAAVSDADLPCHWLLRALVAPDGFDEDCC
jgi:hypothetical protein